MEMPSSSTSQRMASPREFSLDGAYLWLNPATGHKKYNRKREKGLRDPGDDRRPALKDHQQRPCVFLQFDDDENTYSPVYIHLLYSTDVRPVHRSLLHAPDCLGIYHHALQYTSSISSGHPNRSEPIYIRFPTPESLDTWLVLLRTYTTPELYGASFATPLHGGLYRMWRGVELRLLGGRNVGVSLFGSGSKSYKEVPHDDLKAYVRTGYGGGANSLHDVPGLTKEEIGDSPDQELFCEVVICGEVSGRSNVIRGGGVASWNEDFIFSDLPPFAMSTDARSDNSILRIIAYRRSTRSLNFDRLVHKDLRGKKSSHPPSISPGVNSSASSPHILSTSPTADISTPGATMIGFVEISLANFRRGDPIEGFFPIISPISTVNGSGGIHLGDLRLNIIVQEEVILPLERYMPVSDLLSQRNTLRLIADLQNRLDNDIIASHLLRLAAFRGALIKDICEILDEEIEGCTEPNTLFRDSNLTFVLKQAMLYYGQAFLDMSVGKVIRNMCLRSISFDTKTFLSDKQTGKGVAHQVSTFVFWLQEMWDSIYNCRNECPAELRTIFNHIRTRVETKFHGRGAEKLRWQAVTAFCFLRFLTPAIMDPVEYRIISEHPPPDVKRSQTEIVKVLQKMANMEIPERAQHMLPVSEFERKNESAMMDYIVMISSPRPVDWIAGPAPAEKDPVRDAAMDRASRLSVLHREGIPALPRVFDLAKTLAAVTSAVVRNARWPRLPPFHSRPIATGTFGWIENFAMVCFSVENEALKAVTQLDPRNTECPAPMNSPPGTPDPTQDQSNLSPPSPLSPDMVFSQDIQDSGSSTSGEQKHARQSRQSSPSSIAFGESNESLPFPSSDEHQSAASRPDGSSSLPITQSSSTMYPTLSEYASRERQVETDTVVGSTISYSPGTTAEVAKKQRSFLGALRMMRNKSEQ